MDRRPNLLILNIIRIWRGQMLKSVDFHNFKDLAWADAQIF